MDVEPATIVIEPTENGPLLVRNLEALLSADGSPLETKEVTALCRCGGSQKSRFATGRTARTASRRQRPVTAQTTGGSTTSAG